MWEKICRLKVLTYCSALWVDTEGDKRQGYTPWRARIHATKGEKCLKRRRTDQQKIKWNRKKKKVYPIPRLKLECKGQASDKFVQWPTGTYSPLDLCQKAEKTLAEYLFLLLHCFAIVCPACNWSSVLDKRKQECGLLKELQAILVRKYKAFLSSTGCWW